MKTWLKREDVAKLLSIEEHTISPWRHDTPAPPSWCISGTQYFTLHAFNTWRDAHWPPQKTETDHAE